MSRHSDVLGFSTAEVETLEPARAPTGDKHGHFFPVRRGVGSAAGAGAGARAPPVSSAAALAAGSTRSRSTASACPAAWRSSPALSEATLPSSRGHLIFEQAAGPLLQMHAQQSVGAGPRPTRRAISPLERRRQQASPQHERRQQQQQQRQQQQDQQRQQASSVARPTSESGSRISPLPRPQAAPACVPARVAWSSTTVPTPPREESGEPNMGHRTLAAPQPPNGDSQVLEFSLNETKKKTSSGITGTDFEQRVRELRESQSTLKAFSEERAALSSKCRKLRLELDQRTREFHAMQQHASQLQSELTQCLHEKKVLQAEVAIAHREDAAICVICLDDAASYVMVPCGHLALCEACCSFLPVAQCPVCRQTCEQKVRLFRP
mmetsp:Transcript_97061/g.274309  ORF Transcript_97061/g.274309 Transcript_97061/m.274309 type:complete len:380 (+) Transcript_97061:154-1293(+)